MENAHTSGTPTLKLLQNELIELLREGVMLLSRNLKPIYLNPKAKEICQRLGGGNHHSANLPLFISDIYQKLIKNFSSEDKWLLVECQVAGGQAFRIRARYLNIKFGDDEVGVPPTIHQCILVFLEDRNEILEEELWIEQQKYALTERETEIFKLLDQAYSYQEIANKLQISLNTVKFHVKKLYAKKRNYHSREKVEYFELLAERVSSLSVASKIK